MAYLSGKMLIHFAQKTQIALSITEKITVLEKDLDYTDIFLKKSSVQPSKYLDVNGPAIDPKAHVLNCKLVLIPII